MINKRKPTKPDIEAKVRSALAGIIKQDETDLLLHKGWKYYGMDPLATMELIMTIEDEFNIDNLVVMDDQIKTPTQLMNAVHKTLKPTRRTHEEEI